MNTEASTEQFWDRVYSAVEPAQLDSDNSRAVGHALDFFGDVRGKRILDVGCGTGGTSLMLAQAGAEVVALDSSRVAVEGFSRYLGNMNISNVKPIVGDAMKLSAIGQFDFVFGSLILHHLEPFDQFCLTLRAALLPGGKAFFFENNAASDLLVWFRKHVVGKLWVPRYGDDQEFPLTPGEIRQLRKTFRVDVEIPEMKFFQLASAYLFKRRLASQMKAIDDLLFKLRIGTQYSYRQNVLIYG